MWTSRGDMLVSTKLQRKGKEVESCTNRKNNQNYIGSRSDKAGVVIKDSQEVVATTKTMEMGKPVQKKPGKK